MKKTYCHFKQILNIPIFFLNIAHLEKKKNTKENDPDLVQKLSKVAFGQDLVHFLGFILFVNSLYLKNYFEYLRSV